MAYALIKDGNPIPVYGSFTDAEGIQHPASVLRLWSEEELLAIGVHKIVDDVTPEDKLVTGSNLVLDGDVVRRVFDMQDINLSTERVAKKAQIDAEAEVERLKYITSGAGQALTYQAKVEECKRYMASGGDGDYPFLSQEIGITGYTLEDVVDIVMAMHHHWQGMGSAIEKARLTAKNNVDAADTVAAIRAVTPIWPEP